MGLYLCVFDDHEEVEGVDVGSYADFGFFRDIVTNRLEADQPGSKYPTLILHSDCDGQWAEVECRALEKELQSIAQAFLDLPPAAFNGEWQRRLAKSLGLKPTNLYQSFIDVDGEPLLERLIQLCRIAQQHGRPILFQ
jgi:hypothetical protein